MFRKALLFFIGVLRLLETSGSFLQSPENFSRNRPQGPVVQRVDSAAPWINHYPADKNYQN